MTDRVPPSPLLRARERWRSYQQEVASGSSSPEFSLAIAATFTVDPLLPYLGAALLEQGLRPGFRLAPYDQLLQTCANPAEAFGPLPALEGIALLWRLEDVLDAHLAAYAAGKEDAFATACNTLDILIEGVRRLRRATACPLFFTLPPYPDLAPCLEPSGLIEPVSAYTFHRRILLYLSDKLTSDADIHLVDMEALQRTQGSEKSLDRRKAYLFDQPYSEAFLFSLATRIARAALTTRAHPRKCIALDCDNTLWGGLVGEAGLSGIELGGAFPGSVFRDFQRYLQALQTRGYLLALLSRNNEDDVWQVFDHHDAMVLRREAISAVRINWEPKAANIEALAAELNLGLNSFVFIDDNPAEIALMQAAHPEVLSIQVPAERAELIPDVQASRAFDTLCITAEDRRRPTLYQEERERQEAVQALSPAAALASLDIRVTIQSARDEHMNRITQLLARTNQFNLNGVRYSRDELNRYRVSPEHTIHVVHTADRFGECGLTGLAIVKHEPGRLVISSLLLSCRVLGRGIEEALLAYLARAAISCGQRLLDAAYRPTDRNTPLATFLEESGFQRTDEGFLRLRAAVAPPWPSHITHTEADPA